MKYEDIPLGFLMTLAQHPDALTKFSNLSDEKQRQIIDNTHSIKSKQEMQQFVAKTFS